MLQMELTRPIAAIDIEATGISPQSDRIVELAIIKLMPGGEEESHVWRVNPGRLIPAEAIAIHHITDEDVADCPTFPDLAEEVGRALENCDIVGFNHIRFDIPMLTEEFRRANIELNIDDRNIIDVQRIFHRREPRDLSAACRFYCGKDHVGAHGAEPDARVTLDVLAGQMEKYPDLPRDASALDEYCNPRDPSWADRMGRLRWVNGEVTINFGRKRGVSLKTIIDEDSGFVNWMLRNDFPSDTKDILNNAVKGVWPQQK